MDKELIHRREEAQTQQRLESIFFALSLLHNNKDGVAEFKGIREAHERDRFYEELDKSEGDYKEAMARTELPADAPVWKYYGNSVQEVAQAFTNIYHDRAEELTAKREPQLRKAFLPYLESMVLAGMRSGLFRSSWLRACEYGFSIAPLTLKADGKAEPMAFLYTSEKDMPEKDREALRLVVEDMYYELLGKTAILCLRLKAGEKVQGIMSSEDSLCPHFPAEGYKEAKELPIEWYTDVEKHLPIIRHRLDEATYYAVKYTGAEYKTYIESLNVAEDYDYNRGKGKYNEVMKEGYIWHLAE